MDKYIVNINPQANGDHEVHNESKGCSHMPLPKNRKEVGLFDNCREAVAEAKKWDPLSDGCYYCAHECHTR